jgi:hypothetical protein
MKYTSKYEPYRQLVVVLVPELEIEHTVLRDDPSEVDKREGEGEDDIPVLHALDVGRIVPEQLVQTIRHLVLRC